jgi:hypothetical protein
MSVPKIVKKQSFDIFVTKKEEKTNGIEVFFIASIHVSSGFKNKMEET